MKVLIDTNVVLDILLYRQPWYDNAGIIFVLTKQNVIESYISASAITDIFYVAQKQLEKSIIREVIKQLLSVFQPATVTDNDIYQALNLEWNDFEDSVQYVVGEGLAVDYIVTRNTQDFASGSILAVTPEQFIMAITSN
ncbi:MAG: PIN domain-containing protein [Treponema sp.]|nr:PIN domain-containing protein [Treponema sp.]